MSKSGEIEYLNKLGDAGKIHAFNKPFSDPHCGMYLIHLGNIMRLLPSAPAKVLDLGVGTGWTSCFLSRAGYDVLGVEISADMVELAEKNKERWGGDSLQFLVSDYEGLSLSEEFDCAVFYDSLHHAVDETEAIKSAFRALKLGGYLICHEPASGHAEAAESIKARELYDITEKDMPPERIIEVGLEVGFQRYALFDHSWEPQQVGPIEGAANFAKLYWKKLMDLLGTRGEYQKGFKRRKIVVLYR